jgi:hypothetical protein
MAGVAMQTWHPADPHAGVTGVGIVIGLSVLCVAIASIAAGRRRT